VGVLYVPGLVHPRPGEPNRVCHVVGRRQDTVNAWLCGECLFASESLPQRHSVRLRWPVSSAGRDFDEGCSEAWEDDDVWRSKCSFM